MGPLLIFLLTLYQLQTTAYSEIVDSPRFNLNALTELDNELTELLPPDIESDNRPLATEDDSEAADVPFVKSGHEQTEVEFRHPISSVNIDYSKNAIVLKFRKNHPKQRMKLNAEEEAKRRSLDNNFMRFGRSQSDFMRFGKRQVEELPEVNSIDRGYYDKQPGERFERSHEGIRDSRGDNFMRFGRSANDFMRFGRSPADFMRLGRGSPSDFMRFGRSPADFMRFGRGGPDDFMRFGRGSNDFMRFGRGPSQDFMRFGRTPSKDFMRFGRKPKQDFMRFGRNQKLPRYADKNFMRFGRPDNFMRFGRTPPETGTDSSNFMRFGKMDQNFMRFGKSFPETEEQQGNGNHTKPPLLQKNDIKEAAKMLHQAEKDSDESNPMDKAISVFFSKQQQQQQPKGSEESDNSSNDDSDMESEYDMISMPN